MTISKLLFALAAAVSIAACNDMTSSNGDVRVTLASSQGALLASMSSPMTAAVRPADVDSMPVRITSVSVLPESTDSLSEAAWTSLPLPEAGLRVDLMHLGATDEPVQIARGSLPPGNYEAVRFIVDANDAFIRFAKDVEVGGTLYTSGTRYVLRIPSSVIRVAASGFVVNADAGADVPVLLDPSATTAVIVARGRGTVQISPVLHVRH